jgi:stage II sporulation protein D
VRVRLLSAALAATLLAGCSATTASKPSPSVPPPRPVPMPEPVAPVARSSNALVPTSGPIAAIEPPVIRVGLESDQTSAAFPRTDAGYVLVAPDGPWTTRRGFRLDAPSGRVESRFAIQVGAMTDVKSADALAARAGRESGLVTKLHFDTASTTYKVLVGSFASEDAARPSRESLVALGYPRDIFIVRRPSDAAFETKITLVDDEGDRHVFSAESLLVASADGAPVTIGTKTYRGAARVIVNSRGGLNVVNELNLDDYVKGVVPNEMGPFVFDSLEALKAQAMAARTYAISRMGEYRAEGYDICATPSCQVYGGYTTEHPLSNRAVDETKLLVITWGGKPIDALYTSTCGGETSDVGVMFPGRSEPYLKRARCVESSTLEIAGLRAGPSFDVRGMRADVARTLLERRTGSLSSAWSAAQVRAAVEAAGALAGVTPRSAGAPASSRRRDVLRYLADVWGLGDAARRLVLPEDVDYMFGAGASRDDAAWVAALVVKFELAEGNLLARASLDEAMPREELFGLVYGWLKLSGRIREAEGAMVRIDGRSVTVRAKGQESTHVLGTGVQVFRAVNGIYSEMPRVPVQIGDQATVVIFDRAPVAVAVVSGHDGAAYDRRSSWSSWVRSYTEDELVTSISRRNPIVRLEGLKVAGVDASGRVTSLEVKADGRTFTLEGLPIRWSLGVPDNLFVFETSRDASGATRYTFLGKGWGHGVGLCQNGAFGMGLRGFTAEEIVKHYYTGVTVQRYEW